MAVDGRRAEDVVPQPLEQQSPAARRRARARRAEARRPVGVVGAIVPWNYPFHNVFNPMIATIMSANALVLKVSEYASWSIDFYGRAIDACLAAAGAPRSDPALSAAVQALLKEAPA